MARSVLSLFVWRLWLPSVHVLAVFCFRLCSGSVRVLSPVVSWVCSCSVSACGCCVLTLAVTWLRFWWVLVLPFLCFSLCSAFRLWLFMCSVVVHRSGFALTLTQGPALAGCFSTYLGNSTHPIAVGTVCVFGVIFDAACLREAGGLPAKSWRGGLSRIDYQGPSSLREAEPRPAHKRGHLGRNGKSDPGAII